MTMERLGRTTHETFGECVRVKLHHRDGSSTHLFPRDQSSRAAHPRHPSGYDDAGNRTLCVSPSVSYYNELCRYAQFRWTA